MFPFVLLNLFIVFLGSLIFRSNTCIMKISRPSWWYFEVIDAIDEFIKPIFNYGIDDNGIEEFDMEDDNILEDVE